MCVAPVFRDVDDPAPGAARREGNGERDEERAKRRQDDDPLRAEPRWHRILRDGVGALPGDKRDAERQVQEPDQRYDAQTELGGDALCTRGDGARACRSGLRG